MASGKQEWVTWKTQEELQKQPNIDNMTISINTKIRTDLKTRISFMNCLVDGRVIVVESYGKVRLFSSDGKFLKQLTRSDAAWSVTQIKQDTIAITYPLLKVINMFDMKKEIQTKVIPLNKKCYGLSFSNNALGVCLTGHEIRIIDLDGNTRASILVRGKSELFDLVYCNGQVIYSDYSGKAVSCIDKSGQLIWQYQQDLSGPKGLCTDNYGNIIVADYDSNRIILISKHGQDSKILIGKEGVLNAPQYICFNESSGFICNCLPSRTYITIVKLSYE